MSGVMFEADVTALLAVDPNGDFISERGKLRPNVKEIAAALKCVSNMRDVLHAARDAGVRVIFVPHHRWRENEIAGRKYLTPIQRRGYDRGIFEADWWDGEFHANFRPCTGELIAQEHWCSSGFAEHRSQPSQTARHAQADCLWSSRHQVHRFGGPVRGGTGLRSDAGERRIASYRLRRHKSDARIEGTELRDGDCFRRPKSFSAVRKQLRSENVSGKDLSMIGATHDS